ncbi:MAG: calcineurin-like phosphoesterase C-terminal domain-containing protein [Bacteroidales bacterium]|nr:calcineurin-like phosphoesterase C-terminal domain-containing protein [Bacteroidales bacterium]
MRNFRLCAGVLLACAISACVHEEPAEVDNPQTPAEGVEITITASVDPTLGGSKTIRDEATGDILWTPGDRISVFSGSGSGGGAEFISSATENAAVTDFTGTIARDPSSWLWGLYPYSASNACEGDVVTMTLPDTQTAQAGSFAPGYFLSVGRTMDDDMTFRNICGGLRIQVMTEGVKRVTLRSQDGPIAGEALIALDADGVPYVSEFTDGKSEIVLAAPDGQSLATDRYYYFAVFPHHFAEKCFSLTFETDTQIGTYERNSTFDITRSVIEGFRVAVDSSTEYKTISGRISTAEQFIQFITGTPSSPGSAPAMETAGIKAADVVDLYVIDADIDLTGWTATAAASFDGTLDGCGHTISGLQSGVPLFTTLTGCVKNLTFDSSCSFTASVKHFGTVAGTNNGTISNVKNYAPISRVDDGNVKEYKLVAGIAGCSTGTITGCQNHGNISSQVGGGSVAIGVAGVAGYSAGPMRNCDNYGQVSFSASYIYGMVQMLDITTNTALPSIGGVVAYGAPGFSMDNCDNHGKVRFSLTAADSHTTKLNRSQVGGVVGSPCGPVSNCDNEGEVNVSVKHSTPGTPLSQETIFHVGGIGGGDYNFTSKDDIISNTSYTNCTNRGKVIVDSDASASNTAIGGIVGWPGQEVANPGTSVSGCVNHGEIIGRGAMKCRIGGIEGGTGVILNSHNYGTVKVESANTESAVGSLCGFHSQNHSIVGSTAGGKVITNVSLTGGVGGLIGNIGNAGHTTAFDCEVTCAITVTDYDINTMGLVIGKFSGASYFIWLGSHDSPIRVSGSINGTAANTGNIYGIGNYNSNVHVIRTNLDPGSVEPQPTPAPALTESSINGTTILGSSDTAGLITDSTTGLGIPGVPVSDGYSFTVTDANGVYQMQRNPLSRKIYYTTPAAYEINLDSTNHYPEFFTPGIINSETGRIRADFTLTPLATPETQFTLLCVGDPQCYRDSEASRYEAETIVDIQETANKPQYSNVYVMTLGDITFDSYNMWDRMKTTMSNVTESNGRYIPFFQTIGNHDHDSTVNPASNRYESDYNATMKYTKTFGPTDYSFDRGNAHIVSMDNVMVKSLKTTTKPNGRSWEYDGGLTNEQYNWLLDDLSHVDNISEKIGIFCFHIPFRGSGKLGGASVYKNYNYANVLQQMSRFKEAHLMIGHTHYQQNWIHNSKDSNGNYKYAGTGGLPHYEHIHGAACGAWWQASCSSTKTGEPSGYTIYEIDGAHIKDWLFKGTRRDPDFQLRVYDGNDIYYATKSYSLNWYTISQSAGADVITVYGATELQYCFVAQLFDDSQGGDWTVKMYRKSTGEEIGTFEHLPDKSCTNVAIVSYWFNVKGKNSDAWSNNTASHYWYYKPDGVETYDPSSETDWEVRATHNIPGGNVSHTFTCSEITREADFAKEFYFGK